MFPHSSHAIGLLACFNYLYSCLILQDTTKFFKMFSACLLNLAESQTESFFFRNSFYLQQFCNQAAHFTFTVIHIMYKLCFDKPAIYR